MRNHKYGNGVDSTPRVSGDPDLCFAIHNVVVSDCHFDNDKGLWTYDQQRADYEGMVLAGARDGLPMPVHPLGPVWQYRSGAEGPARCHDQRSGVLVSCDHFGSAASGWRDDPQTPVFEGRPSWLARQSDEFGPYAGWWMVPQITPGVTAYVRACPPLDETEGACAPWVLVDWR